MPRKKKKRSWFWPISLVLSLIIAGTYLVLTYQNWMSKKLADYPAKTPTYTEALRFEQVFNRFSDGILGIDISHYQGKIDFAGLQLQLQNRRVEFIVIRATMGDDGIDARFAQNWEAARTLPVVRGAYHYYRPNENSTKQARNFINVAKLESGNLIPVLDIEKHNTIQPREKLREGLKNWFKIVEEHYGVKPMIYTGDRFFWDVLHGNGFDRYPIWVANYNRIVEPETQDWAIWQFSEKGTLPGIGGYVDLNVLVGGKEKLQELVIL